MNKTAKRLLLAGVIALVLHIGFLSLSFNLDKELSPKPEPIQRITVSIGTQQSAEMKLPVEPKLAEKQQHPLKPKPIVTPKSIQEILPEPKGKAEINKEPKVVTIPKEALPPKKKVKPKPVIKKKLVPAKIKPKTQVEPQHEEKISPQEELIQEATPQFLPQQPPNEKMVSQKQSIVNLPTTNNVKVEEKTRHAHQKIKQTIEAKPLYSENPKLKYPARAQKRGWQGTVMLEVEVLADGTAGQVTLHESSGYKILDKTGLSAVKRWRFVPGTVNGVVQTMTVIVPVRFSLK